MTQVGVEEDSSTSQADGGWAWDHDDRLRSAGEEKPNEVAFGRVELCGFPAQVGRGRRRRSGRS